MEAKTEAAVARPKITVYVNDDVYEYLQQRADREIRSVANLVEFIVTQEMMREREQQEQNESQE